MIPYLIQRANFNNNENKTGIDKILSFDYMGSAEFEFGALFNSLKQIRENIKDYVYSDLCLNSKVITVFYNEQYSNKILEYLTGLSKDKFHLKECSYFDKYIYQTGYFKDKYDFWWDIENHIMWWKFNKDFQTQFKKVIKGK